MSEQRMPTRLSSIVAKDRIITQYPQPFDPDATPYTKLDFHTRVKNACSQNKTGTVGLKICKAVIVGDLAVGKTCLVNRFVHNTFDRDYKATIGVDFEVEKFSVLSIPFNLQVWDTAGQERFKCIAASYYRGANVVIVAFDLSDIKTLQKAITWHDDAVKSATDPLVFLVGTKKDLVSVSAYEKVEAEAKIVAKEMNAEYWATSSKTDDHVQEFFFRVVSLTFDSLLLKEIDPSSSTSKKIGNDLIKMSKNDADVYESKSRGKPKCCQ